MKLYLQYQNVCEKGCELSTNPGEHHAEKPAVFRRQGGSVTELMRVMKITKDLPNTINGAQIQDKKKGGSGDSAEF